MNSLVIAAIIGIAIMAAIAIFGSMPPDTWKDHRTEFTGIAPPDEIDEKMDCLSHGGTREYTNCNMPKQLQNKIDNMQSCSGSKLCITEKVTKVVDGDTIYTELHKIRFSLVDTPETGDAGYQQATSFTAMICPVGSTVTIDQDDLQPYDEYGRMLGKVYCENGIINEQLMQNDLAKISTQYCHQSEFSGESWAQVGCSTPTTTVKPTEHVTSVKPQSNSCDPSYPDFCIHSPPPDLNCGDISEKNFRVIGIDPHRFDGDKDGIGCEK